MNRGILEQLLPQTLIPSAITGLLPDTPKGQDLPSPSEYAKTYQTKSGAPLSGQPELVPTPLREDVTGKLEGKVTQGKPYAASIGMMDAPARAALGE